MFGRIALKMCEAATKDEKLPRFSYPAHLAWEKQNNIASNQSRERDFSISGRHWENRTADPGLHARHSLQDGL